MDTTELQLMAAERRGRCMVASTKPDGSQRWLIDVGDDECGASVMVAARYAKRYGADIEMRLPVHHSHTRAWNILADSCIRQGLATAVDGDAGLDTRIRIVSGGDRVGVDCAVEDENAWRYNAGDAWRLAGPVDSSHPRMTVERCRQVDHLAISRYGVAGICLMENAACAAMTVVNSILEDQRSVLVAVGGGNNGGDGLALARGLLAVDIPFRVAMVKPPAGLKGDAAFNYRLLKHICPEAIVDVSRRPAGIGELIDGGTLVVDGLLGTGISGQLAPDMEAVINQINDRAKMVLALDLPSGMDGDTGQEAGTAIRARHTITFAAVKNGLETESGCQFVGKMWYGDIGAPRQALEDEIPDKW